MNKDQQITKLEQLRDYLLRHKRFVNVTKNDKKEPEYWRGYEDAMKAFEGKIESLLRSTQ